MDSGKLPAYRSSYLLRFHPYARVKPSARERIVASTWEDDSQQPLQMDRLYLESDISTSLNQVIYGTDVYIQLRQHHLSVSLVDLAPLFAKRPSVTK